jgi:hypothetical protein
MTNPHNVKGRERMTQAVRDRYHWVFNRACKLLQLNRNDFSAEGLELIALRKELTEHDKQYLPNPYAPGSDCFIAYRQGVRDTEVMFAAVAIAKDLHGKHLSDYSMPDEDLCDGIMPRKIND